jgi:hypothetical protein
MSIQSEITRITNRRDQSFQQVAAKGVTVPAGSTIDDLPDLIAQISTGSGSAVVVTEEPDSSGGIIKNIQAVDLGNDTVDAAHLLQGYTAHDRLGNPVVGAYVAPEQSYTARIISKEDFASGDGITYSGVSYTEAGSTFEFHAGETINVALYGSRTDSGIVFFNNERIGEISTWGTPALTLDVTLPANDIGIRISGGTTVFVYIDECESVVVTPLTATANGTFTAPTGQAYSPVTVNVAAPTPSLQAKTNIAPSTSSQTITADSGFDGLSSVQIDAMPVGTAGTPTAMKSSVSNHSVTITPIVTNVTGYITGSIKSGTGVTVSASELVSGSQTITSNGQTDVTNLASVTVAIPIVTYYTGSSAPASSLGQDGDIYLQS